MNQPSHYDYDMIGKQMADSQEQYFDQKQAEQSGILVSPLPPGTPGFYKVTPGEHSLDVVPFLVATDIHPQVRAKGSFYYKYEYVIHNNLNPAFARCLCVERTFAMVLGKLPENQRVCGVCRKREEEREKPQPNAKWIEDTKGKPRAIYNVWPHTTPQLEAEGVKLMDMSIYCIENPVQAIAKQPFGGGYVIWQAPTTDGRRIYFKRTGTGMTNTKYEAHQFLMRQAPIPQEILSAAVSLDLLVHIPTFDEGYDLVHKVTYETVAPSSVAGQGQSGVTSPSPQTAPPQQPSLLQQQQALQMTMQPQPQVAAIVCPGGGSAGKDFDQLPSCKYCAVLVQCYSMHKEQATGVENDIPFNQPAAQETPTEAPKEEPATTAVRTRARKRG